MFPAEEWGSWWDRGEKAGLGKGKRTGTSQVPDTRLLFYRKDNTGRCE